MIKLSGILLPLGCGIPPLDKVHTFHGPQLRHKTCSTSRLRLPPTKTKGERYVFSYTIVSNVFSGMCEMKGASPSLLEAVKQWEKMKIIKKILKYLSICET